VWRGFENGDGLLLTQPAFCNNSTFSTGFYKATWFNWVILWIRNHRGFAKQLLSLTAHPSNTNNQQLITRLYPKRTARYTRLAAALLPLPNIWLILETTILSIRPRIYCLRCQLSTCRMEQDSSSLTKFASKFEFLQLRRKIFKDTKNVIELCLQDDIFIPHYVLLFIEQQEVILLHNERLDDLK